MSRLTSVLADPTPLRVSPPFRRLWWGLAVSNLGAQLTVVAVSLQVYALTGSTFAVGGLGFASLVPLVALGLYGGALVDTHDRRKVALAAAWVLWFATALIAAQAWLHLESVWLLYALVAIQSAAFAINNPARSAIIPRLLEPRLLPAANALGTISWNIALTAGPLAGAFLVGLWGYQAAYTIDCVLFTAALWAVWRLPAIPPTTAPSPGPAEPGAGPAEPERGWRSVLAGLRYLATRPNVRTTFVVDIIAMVFAFPQVLLPAAGVVYLGGGEATTGTLAAAFAVGGILAGLFSGGLARIRRQGRVIVWAITSWGMAVAAFGLVLVAVGPHRPSGVVVLGLVGACLALAVAGGSDAVSAVFRQTILQSATPDNMRGRLQGVFIVVVAGGPRLGQLTLGSEAAWLGEAWAAVVGGLTCVVVLWSVVRVMPRFWAYDAEHPEP